jgi:hypothetical protein
MSGKRNFEDLSSIAYADRQLVVVMPDDIVAASRRAEADAVKSEKRVDWTAVTRVVTGIVTKSISYALIEVISEALTAWARARQSGLNVL